MARAVAVGVLGLALVACPSSVPFPNVDSGFFAGDAFVADAFPLDAFHWPDTGPPLPAVLPAQSWTMMAQFSDQLTVLTIDLDARAESGVVRGVGGGSGRSSSVLFDIQPTGILVSRDPITVGWTAVTDCSEPTLSIDRLQLTFVDRDGDGIHETLTSADSIGTTTRQSDARRPSQTTEIVQFTAIEADVSYPSITLAGSSAVFGVEPIELTASEPIAPSFMPRVTGTRSAPFVPDVSVGAAAHWTLETRALPVGHYELALGAPQDLTGLAPQMLPSLTFDIAPLAAPAFDDVDPNVVAVVSSPPGIILGDDPGEVPIAGTTSYFAMGRTVIVFDASLGAHMVTMSLRFDGPSSLTIATAALTVFDPHGVPVASNATEEYLDVVPTVPGFAMEGIVQQAFVPFSASIAGRYYTVLQLGTDPTMICAPPPPDGSGVAIDQITID